MPNSLHIIDRIQQYDEITTIIFLYVEIMVNERPLEIMFSNKKLKFLIRYLFKTIEALLKLAHQIFFPYNFKRFRLLHIYYLL